MLRFILISFVVMISQYSAAQQEKTHSEVPFAVIEKVPIYPGCDDNTNAALKHCMSQKISAFVSKNFKIKKASKGLEPGVHRVYVSFKIDKTGKVTDVASRAPNDALEKEATRVIKKLPRMTPGQQKGKNVGVLYSLPITFEIEDKKKKT